MLKVFTNTELPESNYHGEEYSDYLSGSELWGFLDKCPAEQVYGEVKEKASYVTGSAVHSEVLEMSEFESLYYKGYETKDTDIRTQAGIKAELKRLGIKASAKGGIWSWCHSILLAEPDSSIEEIESLLVDYNNAGKIKLKPEAYDMAKDMRSQLMNYPSYAEYIDNGLCEHSIIGEIEIDGVIVKVKTRPDIIHDGSIVNYKTTANAKPDKIISDAFNYGYLMKEYFNALVFEKMHGYFPVVKIMSQSKTKPYVVTGVTLTDEQLEIGRLQFEKAFALWRACKEAGAYIDYAQGEWIEVETPQWMVNRVVN